MSTRSDIRDDVKGLIPRRPGDIDDRINELIDTGIELMSSMIESVFQEELWKHTFTSAEITADTDNWALPSRTKRILSCALVDTSGDEDREYPLVPVSPKDKHRIGEIDDNYGSAYYPETFPSAGWRWDLGKRNIRRGTYKRDGRPRLYYRINNNVYVYPRPDTNEVDNRLEILIAKKPDLLTADDSTNVITENYPRALIHYVAGLLWKTSLNQQERGNSELQIAGKLMQEFAYDDEIQKLISVDHMMMGRRY